MFGGQGNSKRRCRYMHFNKSSLVPHPQLKLVNKFGNLNSISISIGNLNAYNVALKTFLTRILIVLIFVRICQMYVRLYAGFDCTW